MNARKPITNARKHLVLLTILISSFTMLLSPTFSSATTPGTVIYSTPICFSGKCTVSRFSPTAYSLFLIMNTVLLVTVTINLIFPLSTTFKTPLQNTTTPDSDFPSSSTNFTTPRFSTSVVILNPGRLISPENNTFSRYLGLVNTQRDIDGLNAILIKRTGSWIECQNNLKVLLTSLAFMPKNLLSNATLDLSMYIQQLMHLGVSTSTEDSHSFTSWIEDNHYQKNFKVFLTGSSFKPENMLLKERIDLSLCFQEPMSLEYSASTEDVHSMQNWIFKSFGIKLFNPRIHKPYNVRITSVPPWFPDDYHSLSRCNNYSKKIDVEVSGSVFIFAYRGYMSVKRCWEKAQVARTPREFTYKELKITTNDFDLEPIIGQGSIRTVYKTCEAKSEFSAELSAMDNNLAWHPNFKAQLCQDPRQQSEIDSWQSKNYYSSPAGKLGESEESENEIEERAWSQHVKYSSNYERKQNQAVAAAMDKNIAWYKNLNAQSLQEYAKEVSLESSNLALSCFQIEENTSSDEESDELQEIIISTAELTAERNYEAPVEYQEPPPSEVKHEDYVSVDVRVPLTHDKVKHNPKIHQRTHLCATGILVQQNKKQAAAGNQIKLKSLTAAETVKCLNCLTSNLKLPIQALACSSCANFKRCYLRSAGSCTSSIGPTASKI